MRSIWSGLQKRSQYGINSYCYYLLNIMLAENIFIVCICECYMESYSCFLTPVMRFSLDFMKCNPTRETVSQEETLFPSSLFPVLPVSIYPHKNDDTWGILPPISNKWIHIHFFLSLQTFYDVLSVSINFTGWA